MRKLALCIAMASIVVLPLGSHSPVKADDEQNESIVGTWILTATLDTPPGSPPFAETELTAINPGGSFTLTSSAFNSHTSENPFLPPFLVADFSDGYGTWKRQGGSNQFASTFKRHLFAGNRTDPTLYGSFFVGQHVGEATIQSVFRLSEDGDTLEGKFTFQVRNLKGEIVGGGSGTLSATRLKIEPLATP